MEIDAFRFELPVMASPADSVVSPATAAELGRLGAVGVLHLEGLWTRYADPDPVLEEIAGLPAEKATSRMQELYSEPVQPDLVGQRISELKAGGHTVAVACTPQRTLTMAPYVLRAEPDLLVVQGTVVSAEHVSRQHEPLNLKDFIRHYEIPVVVGRLHLVPGGAPPHAHRRRRRARGRAARARPARPGACSASASRWPPPSPTRGPLGCATSTRPACTSTSSPTEG